MQPYPHNPLWSGPAPVALGPYRRGPMAVAAKAAPRPTTPRALRPVELLAAVGLVVLVDVCLWSDGLFAAGGIGLALLFTAAPLVVFATIRRWRRSVQLGIVAALLVAIAARCLYEATPTVIVSGLVLLTAFTLGLRSRRTFVPEIAYAATAGQLFFVSRVRAAFRGTKRLFARTRFEKMSVLPLVVPAGLVALFVGVFALANPLVAHAVDRAWTVLASLVKLPSFGRVVLWSLAAIFGLALLRPTFRSATRNEAMPDQGEASAVSLSTARNALIGLNVVFLLYNALDARYLWTGSPPAGMHTQQYAHAGAFWLTVALVMLTAVIGVMFRGPLASDPRANDSRWLAYAWIAQGLVLALGTYRRIAIHIAKSGLSDLRIVGILGTTLVVCGVVLVLMKVRSGKTFLWVVRRQLDAFMITAIVYAIVPTHLLSATVNVARVESGEYRPVLHAFRQSHETESAAALLPLLDHPDVRVHQGVAALLADERLMLHMQAEHQSGWRQRDFATAHATASLDAAEPKITAALGDADPNAARGVLLEISRAANEDRSLEEILSIPAATTRADTQGTGSRERQ